MRLYWISIFFALSIGYGSLAFAQSSDNLYPLYKDKTVKVFISEAKDSTKTQDADLKELSTKVEEALKSRKSITFRMAPTVQEADIVIDLDVQEFLWTDHDPVDMLMGTASAAYDIATVEDYARLQADVTVSDTKTKKVLWKDRVMGTITKKPMTKLESLPLVSENFAKSFIKNCFSKRRSR